MSTPRLESCVPLPLEDDVLEEIVNKARDWALMHGAAMRSKDNFSKDLIQLAPFVLLPSPFPRKEFEKAVAIQPILNELMHKVAHSHEFLVASLKSTIEVDEFTRKLFEIYETVNSEGISQTFQLGLFRSDYFADSAANFGIKQVEFNTIASSFGGIATNISQYNRYVLQELGHDDKVKNLPTNGALQGICEALAEAWTIYADLRAVVMIVVENVTYNICDQRFHEFEIRELHPEIRVIRKTLTEIGEQGKLGPMKELIM